MRPMILRLAIISALSLGSAHGQDAAGFQDRISRLTSFFATQLPEGHGPFPLMIMVTGCSGFHNERFSASYARDERRLIKEGYAVARADFVRAHGLDNSCPGAQNSSGEVVPDEEVVAYIAATVEHMRRRSDIDANRVFLFGYSMGGTGILNALNETEIATKILGVLNYFPRCEGVSTWSARVPMLLMLAELDNIVPPEHCKNLVRRVDQPEVIEVVEYPDAHHCFIAEDTPIVTEPKMEPTCAFNPHALASSWGDILEFLEPF